MFCDEKGYNGVYIVLYLFVSYFIVLWENYSL